MKKDRDDEKDNDQITDDQNGQQVSLEEFEKLQTEFSTLQELTQRLDAQLKRAVADYQNLEKRVEEGRSELSSWASSDLIRRIVPVLDHFDKALSGAGEDEKKSGWFRGVELAVQQLQNVLRDEGLEQIEIRADGQFDPALHEAVDTREGDDNMVLEVAEKGYTLNGKVLKPAKVIVGRKG